MVTIKSYTSLEQSEKLAEILPLESADACWTNHLFGDLLSSFRVEGTPPQEYKHLLDRFVVKGYIIEPAWSLAALFNVIPQEIFDGEYIINICEGCDNKWELTYDHYENRNYSFYELSSCGDNLIDTCYELVVKLYEHKLL